MNDVHLLGNVGKDPDIKTFDNGGKQATFTLATFKKGFTTKNNTVIPDKTTWHNIVCKGGLATFAEQWVKKGGQFVIKGEIDNRSYEKDGVTKYVSEIVATNIYFAGAKTEGGSPSSQAATPLASADSGDDLPF